MLVRVITQPKLIMVLEMKKKRNAKSHGQISMIENDMVVVVGWQKTHWR